jgi:hypothetical protein
MPPEKDSVVQNAPASLIRQGSQNDPFSFQNLHSPKPKKTDVIQSRGFGIQSRRLTLQLAPRRTGVPFI